MIKKTYSTIRRFSKRGFKNASFIYKSLSWKKRKLPDFIIIGAQKSGTTSLYHYLGQHPEIIPSCRKEVHYFDGGLDPSVDNYKKGQKWYRAHFPMKVFLGECQKCFEASPLYMLNPLVPKRIHKLIPNVKLIAVLRNPTQRAISHYFHETKKKTEYLSITDALKAEEVRIKQSLNNGLYKSHEFIHYSYKFRGHYYEQLNRFYELFPKNNMLVINSDDLFSQTEKTLFTIFNFIGVSDQFQIKNLQPRNVSLTKKDVPSEVLSYLDDYFRPYNKLLIKLLGRDFGW